MNNIHNLCFFLQITHAQNNNLSVRFNQSNGGDATSSVWPHFRPAIKQGHVSMGMVRPCRHGYSLDMAHILYSGKAPVGSMAQVWLDSWWQWKSTFILPTVLGNRRAGDVDKQTQSNVKDTPVSTSQIISTHKCCLHKTDKNRGKSTAQIKTTTGPSAPAELVCPMPCSQATQTIKLWEELRIKQYTQYDCWQNGHWQHDSNKTQGIRKGS